MGVTIHIHGASATDTLAAVIIIDDRVLALADELIIEHIDHLEEGSVLIDMLHLVGLEVTLLMTVPLTPNLNFNVNKLIHNLKCASSLLCLLVITCLRHYILVVKILLIHHRGCILAGVSPARYIAEVLIVAESLILIRLVLLSEVGAT